MLEKIEVGKTYLDGAGDKVTVLFTGRNQVFYSWKDVTYHETTSPISFAKESWSELPKEPEKIGQLYMCIKHSTYSKIGDPMIFPVGANVDERYWRPVTVNETGEVYSVE